MRTLLLSLLLCIPAFSQDKVCTSSAPVVISASGLTKILDPMAPAAIQICSLSLASSAATDLTLKYGTGSSCGTGTTSLSGAYKAITTFGLNWGGTSGPIVPPGTQFCLNSSASVTIGGLITYRAY